MTHGFSQRLATALAAAVLLPVSAVSAGDGALPDNDVMMTALVEELDRSMLSLMLDDLAKPYFIQYSVQDRLTFEMEAALGGLISSSRNRFRAGTSRVRVGSYVLDNTNVGRGFGGRALLPHDDHPVAIRHALWRMTDTDYKMALQTLTQKRAYLKQRNVEDRPDDFSKADPVHVIEPAAEIAFDQKAWEENVKRLSARLGSFPHIQDSYVSFFAGAVNEWIVNSEGTRLRTADRGLMIEIYAETQAPEGMWLSDTLSYLAMDVEDVPPIEKMLADVDEMSAKLEALRKAPVLDHYVGPILFEPVAAGQILQALLANGLCARPMPLGATAADDLSFEKKIGRRVLPRTFQVFDDPGPERFEGKLLAGAYKFDDEGVRPKRLELVTDGVLKTLLAGRAPTRKIKHTTGHGRSGGFADATAQIGCLYVSDDEGLPADQLKQRLIEAAREEDLDFALRIEALEEDGYGGPGDPIHVFKVFVDDGREERVRGLQFLPIEPRSLKRIVAAGRKRKVYNSTAGILKSIIAPAVLFEELELTRVEQEFDKLPILKPPGQRS